MSSPAEDRRREVLALLVDGNPQAPLVERVCAVSIDLLGVSGAGMCLIAGHRQEVVVHGTDSLIAELEDLQVLLRQGPCVQAVRSALPVLVPELRGFSTRAWPAFAAEAVRRDVRALFSFPLNVGPVRVGVLDLYRRTPGPLDVRQLGDARILTGFAAQAMLTQQDRTQPDGTVSALNFERGTWGRRARRPR